MKVIRGARQSGKTTELIRLSAQHQYAPIVCATHAEAYRIAEQAREMEVQIPFPLTYDEFRARKYEGRHIDAFYIDNADHILQYMTHVRIAAISITDEESE